MRAFVLSALWPGPALFLQLEHDFLPVPFPVSLVYEVVTCPTILSELLSARTSHLPGITESSLLHATCSFGELQCPSPRGLETDFSKPQIVCSPTANCKSDIGFLWGTSCRMTVNTALDDDEDVAGNDKSRVRGQCCWGLSL